MDAPSHLQDSVKQMKAHCPKCDGSRSCDIHGQARTSYHYDHGRGNETNGGADHWLLQCRGCEIVFYLQKEWSDQHEDVEYDSNGDYRLVPVYSFSTHPSPDSKIAPSWFPDIVITDWQLFRILSQVYTAVDAGSNILAAVGLRTALDRAIELVGIDPAWTFEEKLDALKVAGLVGDTELGILDVIIDAGSAAAHRGWEPGKADVLKLLRAVEAFLHRAFIVGTDAMSVKMNIPDKPKRKIPRSKKPKSGSPTA